MEQNGEHVPESNISEQSNSLNVLEIPVYDNSVIFNPMKDLKKNGGMDYFCATCNKKCASRMNLREHERVHTGEKPHKCEKCLKTFRFRSHFNRHKLTHGEPSFKCSICQNMFITNDTLKKHFRNKHSQEPPKTFKCILCEKIFPNKKELQEHYLIHTGEKPFSCERCNKRFITKYLLRFHQKNHCGEEHFATSFSSNLFTLQHQLNMQNKDKNVDKNDDLLNKSDESFKEVAALYMDDLDQAKDNNASAMNTQTDVSVDEQSVTYENIQSSQMEDSQCELEEIIVPS